MARVLVTDARLGSAVAVIRSLGRRGHHVIAADSARLSPGFYSRHAGEQMRYPPPTMSPDGMVEALLRAVKERGVDLVIPVTDDVIVPLSEQRDRFADTCVLAMAEPSALAVARDKERTLDLARRLGIPTPHSVMVSTRDEARRLAGEMDWPLVLKPQLSRILTGRGTIEAMRVSYAEDQAGLADQMGRFEGRCPVVLQEYVSGEGQGIELLTQAGIPLAAFQHRRHREVPVTGGASSLRESMAVRPALYEHAVRLLGALRWTGLAMVEFKVGARGPVLMEINGRIWGSLPLAVRSGMDFPARLVDLLLTGSPEGSGSVDTSYALGVRSRDLELELVWISSVLRRRRRHPFLSHPPRSAAVAAALRLLSTSDGYDILTREDLRPGLADLCRIAGKPVRKLRHAS